MWLNFYITNIGLKITNKWHQFPVLVYVVPRSHLTCKPVNRSICVNINLCSLFFVKDLLVLLVGNSYHLVNFLITEKTETMSHDDHMMRLLTTESLKCQSRL